MIEKRGIVDEATPAEETEAKAKQANDERFDPRQREKEHPLNRVVAAVKRAAQR
jgi:hypothetical protein